MLVSPAPPSITQPGVLVVEGKEDQRFFERLLRTLGIESIHVKSAEGRTKYASRLAALLDEPGFSENAVSLGIERDAQGDPAATFDSLCGALEANGLPVPRRPLEPAQGELYGRRFRVTVAIMPRADQAGMLEDVCLASVRDDARYECVERLLDCLTEKGVKAPANLAKARLHAFLACMPKPGLRLGEAAEAGYWPFDDPAFDEVKRFLKLVAV